MSFQAGFEGLPEVDIRQLAAFALPTPPAPIWQPLADTPTQVLRIGIEIHLAWFFECLQRLYSCSQLHAVIGSLRIRPDQLSIMLAKDQ